MVAFALAQLNVGMAKSRWLTRIGILLAFGLWSVICPAVAWAADTKPPSTPANFEATVSSDSPQVNLGWSAATDESGIKAYRLERSLDGATWSLLSDAIATNSYTDKDTSYGVHYYYRLLAVDTAGNSSDWAATDVETPTFHAGGQTTVGDTTTYTSSDGLAAVAVSRDAVKGGATLDCSIGTVVPTTQQLGSQSQPLVLGPYVLACKTIAGLAVYSFEKPVKWRLDISGKLKGSASNPQLFSFTPGETPQPLSDSRYDAKTQMVYASTVDMNPVVVLAEGPRAFLSANFVVFLLVVAGLICCLVMFMIHRKRKLDHENYLRTKYYNL